MTSCPGRVLLLVCALGFLCSCGTMRASGAHGAWSYEVAGGIEKTSRAYLLVSEGGTERETGFEVHTVCSKPIDSEGTYGQCAHTVRVDPSDKTFSLPTGEDVVMVRFARDAPAMLATIGYGCCAGPDTAAFYTGQGRYLGKLDGRNLSFRGTGNNVILREYDMGNGTRYRNRLVLLVLGEPAESGYVAVVLESGREVRKIPVHVSNAGRNICEEWYIERFTRYEDRKGVTLELQGYFCNNRDGVLKTEYDCAVLSDSISCEIRKQ